MDPYQHAVIEAVLERFEFHKRWPEKVNVEVTSRQEMRDIRDWLRQRGILDNTRHLLIECDRDREVYLFGFDDHKTAIEFKLSFA
jgi:predicted RNA binding protein with dsRBD fold (UPF0201 family)